MGRPVEPVLPRFLAKATITDGCWPWTAKRDIDGYGVFWLEGKNRRASRVSYELFVGPIPPSHEIDHRCGNTTCVNPDHLDAVTSEENHRRRRLCECGECRRCKHREYMRDYTRQPEANAKNRRRARLNGRRKRQEARERRGLTA